MINLENQLEKFRETAEKNPNLAQDSKVGFRRDLINLIKRFLGEAKNRHVKEGVCNLVYYLTLNNPRCYRIEPTFKIDTPPEFYKGLKSTIWLSELILPYLSEIGFKKGFNIDAKNFVANIYKIIYDAYLKEYAEEERKVRRDP